MTNKLVNISIDKPSAEFAAKAANFLALANSYEIDSNEMKDFVVQDIRDIQKHYDEIEKIRKQLKTPIDDAAKNIQAFFKPPLETLATAKRILTSKLDTYIDAQIKEESRLRKIAFEEAQVAAKEKLQQSALAADNNLPAVSEALALEAAIIPAIAALRVQEVEKTQGVVRREVWEIEVTDKLALIKQVCGMDRLVGCLIEVVSRDFTADQMRAGLKVLLSQQNNLNAFVPMECLTVNEQFITDQARAMKGELNYAGIKVTSTTKSSIRRE